MRKRKLDLTAVTVESFYPAGGPSLSANATDAGPDDSTYSAMVCDTEHDTDCSTYCLLPTYVWQFC